jgi:S1-C subfamily serine protease
VNALDLVLVALAVLAAVGGWRLGFLTRALGWAGAAFGLVVALRAVPAVLGRLDLTSDTAVILLGLAGFLFLISLGQALGVAIGSRFRPRATAGVLRSLDALGGAVLGIVGVAVLGWLVLPVMAGAQGWPAALTRNSTVARVALDHLPRPPRQLVELERQLAGGRFPQLFADLRPAPELPAPPVDSPVDAALLQAAALSSVRVEGDACRSVQSGSGFVVAPGLIATNAHVVAGTERVRLTGPAGETATGVVVAFDPGADLALVRSDLDRPPLPLADPVPGDRGLVLGFPGGGPFDPSSFEVGQLLDARGFDIYDTTQVRRRLLILAADLEPGDSGSAVLRADGAVIGVAVAIAPDRPGVAYALQPDELAPLLATAAGAPVSTGRCLR